MLVTEYRRRAQEWQKHRQYYRFRVRETERDTGHPLPRYSCPGCAREFTAVFLNAHVCSGGTALYPRIENPDGRGRYPRNTVNRSAGAADEPTTPLEE